MRHRIRIQIEFWQLLDKFRPWDWFLVVHEHRIRIQIEFWQLLDKFRLWNWFQVVLGHWNFGSF